MFSLCSAVIIKNNHKRNDKHYSSNIVQKRPGLMFLNFFLYTIVHQKKFFNKNKTAGNDRVQIRVYRGPESEHGGKKFAPWGFLVRQPADD